MRLFSFCLTLILSVSLSAKEKPICETLDNATQMGNPSQRLQRFLTEQWNYQMRQYPEWATYVGFPGQNDRWTDDSLEATFRREKEKKCQLAILKKIRRESLKGEDRISHDLAVRDLELDIEGQKFDGKFLVLDHMGGVHIDAPDLIAKMPTVSVKDYENIISRLEKLPILIAQHEILLREGLKRKVTAVQMFLKRVPGQFDQVLTAKAEDSPLYMPFREMSAAIPEAEQKRLQIRAKDAIEKASYPALKKLKAFLQDTYIPGAREKISISEMPNGKAWYAFKVKVHTTTQKTPKELHDLGLNEVTQIRARMEKLKDQAKFKGDLKAFDRFLLSDSQFFFSNPKDLMTAYRDIAKQMDAELPRFFKRLPRLSYGVREMPAYKAPQAPAAYYHHGSLESGRAGYFEANTYDLKARPKWAMEALTFHEAVPGHHLQLALAQEIEGFPEFRKNGGITAFVEGWGLYAESLGSEMGFYKDVYSKYGEATYDMWRAVRLVVDTGMHEFGWSREKAIEYAASYLPKAGGEIEQEIDRYITWPGQALAYKVGQLKFKELRARAQQVLGARFDIREFHDEVLRHGALPMDVLETTFNEWLNERAKTVKTKGLALDKTSAGESKKK